MSEILNLETSLATFGPGNHLGSIRWKMDFLEIHPRTIKMVSEVEIDLKMRLTIAIFHHHESMTSCPIS